MKARQAFLSVFLGALLWALAGPAPATLTLSPSNYDFTTLDTSNLGEADIASLFGTTADLDLLYKASVGEVVAEDGLFQDSYSTLFGFQTGDDPLDPSSARITYDGAPDPFITCPECYLVVKDGRQEPAQYLFDIGRMTNSGIWDGIEPIEMVDFWPNNGAISNVAIWGDDPVDVPAPGTLALLGLSLLLLVLVHSRFRGRRFEA